MQANELIVIGLLALFVLGWIADKIDTGRDNYGGPF